MLANVKLQNLVLQKDLDDNLMCYPQLIVRDQNGANPFYFNPEKKAYILCKHKYADFMSYYNCLQLQRWKTYTKIKQCRIVLEFKGKVSFELYKIYRNSDNIDFKCIWNKVYENREKRKIVIPLPEILCSLIGFKLAAVEDTEIYGGYYAGDIEESNIRNIHISLVTTTYKKQNYILQNIKTLQEKILNSKSELKGHLTVHVIDNECALDAQQYSSEDLRIYPNKNVGGAGGFTRGMIEALKLVQKPTHILLMDDDVMLTAESLFRTYYLLRILKEDYQACFLSGAMFDYDIRERQYEDVGYINRTEASYGPVKPLYDMRELKDVVRNEAFEEYTADNAYSGWWYCCIPVEHIEKNGLPLPVFVRGDDVEFSLRNRPGFITLNGICIWHVGFAGKFNAAMELYQVHRNSLIIQAAGSICQDIDFYKRIQKMFWKEITRFAYANAELLLDAVEDYMKGPEYIKNLDGEQSLREHNAKNEKLVPLSELPYPAVPDQVYEYVPIKRYSKWIYIITINGHLLPDFLLKSYAASVAYDWFFTAGAYYRRRRMIAINPINRTGCIRTMDRRKCFALIRRYMQVTGNYKKRHTQIEKQYRESFPEMTSKLFWENYLGI